MISRHYKLRPPTPLSFVFGNKEKKKIDVGRPPHLLIDLAYADMQLAGVQYLRDKKKKVEESMDGAKETLEKLIRRCVHNGRIFFRGYKGSERAASAQQAAEIYNSIAESYQEVGIQVETIDL